MESLSSLFIEGLGPFYINLVLGFLVGLCSLSGAIAILLFFHGFIDRMFLFIINLFKKG